MLSKNQDGKHFFFRKTFFNIWKNLRIFSNGFKKSEQEKNIDISLEKYNSINNLHFHSLSCFGLYFVEQSIDLQQFKYIRNCLDIFKYNFLRFYFNSFCLSNVSNTEYFEFFISNGRNRFRGEKIIFQ